MCLYKWLRRAEVKGQIWVLTSSGGLLGLHYGIHYWLRLWGLICTSYDFVELNAEKIEHAFEVHSPYFLLGDVFSVHNTFVALAQRLVDITQVFL